MFKKLWYRGIVIALAVMVIVLPLEKVDAIEITYDAKEIAFVESLFDKNNLTDSNASKNNPSSWGSFIDWQIVNQPNGSQLRRIKKFRLISKNLTGSLIINSESGLDYLVTLDCASNELEKLEISNLPLLETVSCYGNKLTNLKISDAPNYQKLECWNNQLTNLANAMPSDVLSCGNNPLEILDLSNAVTLTRLSCSKTGLNNLNITNLDQLEYLDCSNNNLKELDFTKNSKLKSLNLGNDLLVGKNYFKSIDLTMLKDLETFVCLGAGLEEIKYDGLNQLTQLNVGNNSLTNLDVSKLTKLIGLQCYGNHLIELKLGKLYNLSSVLCYRNKLVTLDLQDQIALKELDCSDNQLTELKLPDTNTLNSINLENNQLSEIDLSKYQITNVDFFNTRDGIRGINNNPITEFKIENKEYSAKAANGKIEVLGYKYKTGEMTLKAISDQGYKFDQWNLSADIDLISGDLNSDIITFILPAGKLSVEAMIVNDDTSLQSLSYTIDDGATIAINDLDNNYYTVNLPRTTKLDAVIKVNALPTSDLAQVDEQDVTLTLEQGTGIAFIKVTAQSGKEETYIINFNIETAIPDLNNRDIINGVEDKGTYQQQDILDIEAKIVENQDGVKVAGDTRFVPLKWSLKENNNYSGNWQQGPYTLKLENLNVGKYTLVIEYQLENYLRTDSGFNEWVINDETIEKEFDFTITENEIPIKYELKVLSGSGDGFYRADDRVEITADQIAGKKFDYWQIISGDGQIINNKEKQTIFVMTSSDAVVQAIYQEVSNPPAQPNPGASNGIKTGDIDITIWLGGLFISMMLIYCLKSKNHNN